MIDKQFDDILKRKLDNMTEAGNSDWAVFEQKLDHAQSTETSTEGRFDNAIKQKLGGMTAASVSSDWSTFEQMLDEDQLTDQMLDSKVSEEMNNMRAPYRQDHWELLHDNLELQKTRNQNIIGYKIIELSLLFIILLSANNLYKYLPSTFEIEKPVIYATLDGQPHQTKKSILSETLTTDLPNSNSESTDINSEASIDEISTTNTNVISATIASSILSTSSTPSTSPVISLDNNETKDNIHSDISVPSEYIVNTIAYNPEFETSAKLDVERIIEKQMEGIEKVNSTLRFDRETIDLAARYTPHILYPSTKITKSITAYAGIDNNLVNSPFDDVYDVEGFRTYGIGYSAGIDYSILRGITEWSIGIGYSNRSYEPRIIDELTGDAVINLFDTSLEHIEFDIFSLSAGVKRTLKETKNWILDFGIGASANIVAHTNYEIVTVSILRDGKFVSSRVNTPKGLDLNAKPLHDGINEGGSLQENIYITTDISLGLQRKMSENTFFTVRPEYSLHSFSNGIGPNNDLINNLSLNLGVKYIL